MESNQPIIDKCPICRKKIAILRFQCKFCDLTFCSKHQLPEEHECNIRDSINYGSYKEKTSYQFRPMTKMERMQNQQ